MIENNMIIIIVVVVYIILQIIFGLISRAIVKEKCYPDNENHGFAWGFWLGVIGLIICLCKSKYKPPKKTSSKRTFKTMPPQPSRNHYPPTNRNTFSSSSNSRIITKQNFSTKLQTLADSSDDKISSSEQNKRLASNARTYRSYQKRSFSTSKVGETIQIDLSWSENLAELLEATEIVYSNAQMNCNRRLTLDRFHYYVHLHYRSFTAADLCHAKLEEIRPYNENLKKIILRLRDRNDSLKVDKNTYNQLISLRNTMGDICNILRQRRDQLNQQTAIIRDKIKAECGERGLIWYNNLMERAGK